jgi:hypothetical protein
MEPIYNYAQNVDEARFYYKKSIEQKLQEIMKWPYLIIKYR